MAGLQQKRPPNGLRTPRSKLPRDAIEFPVSPKVAPLQGEVFLPLNSVNATMAGLEAGRGRKGKNFSAEEETCLCRSFLVVSQDPVCGNGQCNTAFWERITTHFNRVKARGRESVATCKISRDHVGEHQA